MCVYIYKHTHLFQIWYHDNDFFPFQSGTQLEKRLSLNPYQRRKVLLSTTVNNAFQRVWEVATSHSLKRMALWNNLPITYARIPESARTKQSSLNEHTAMPRKQAWGHWYAALRVTHVEWTSSRGRPWTKPPLVP